MFFLKQLFRAREHLQMNRCEVNAEMTFLEHLEELRRTIFHMLMTLGIAMCLCFCFSQHIMEILRYPAEDVWYYHEADKLPQAVTTEDWIQAKEAAKIISTLSPQQSEQFKQRLPKNTCTLAELVPVLQAAYQLTENGRYEFIESTLPTEQQQTAISLLESGADLRTEHERHSLKMMGAFQPGEAFIISLKLAFFSGLILAFPILLYQLLRFIIPGLYDKERRMLYKCIGFGFALFIFGCAFAYFGVLPRVLSFFYNYSEGMGIVNDWRISYYLSFSIKLIFIFGVIFELPVIVIPLIKMGILTYALMKKTRAYALIGCFIIALILAPAPDPGTMIIMALPMYLLYELCIIYAGLQNRKTHHPTA